METLIFDDVTNFLDTIPESDAAKILAHLKALQENQTEGLFIKPLKGKIKEIVIRQYRIIFFEKGTRRYAVDAFKKQSKKTPQRIINRAEKIYKSI